MGSDSLGFPEPAGPRPETRLAGYHDKLNPVIQRLFRVFPSNVATALSASPDGAASPPEGRTMGIIRFFFARLARSTLRLLISVCFAYKPEVYQLQCTAKVQLLLYISYTGF